MEEREYCQPEGPTSDRGRGLIDRLGRGAAASRDPRAERRRELDQAETWLTEPAGRRQSAPLRSGREPILHREVGDASEMTDVSGYEREIVGRRDRGDPEVGLGERST